MKKTIFALALAPLFLTACGGGGGDGGTTVSTADFPVRAAYIAMLQSGRQTSYTVTGSCTGTATETVSPTVSDGSPIPTLSSTSIITTNLSGCTSPTATTKNFYRADYSLTGYLQANGEYDAATSSTVIPATLRVGDTLPLATLTRYSDSSRTTQIGTATQVLTVEPDTATTAIIVSSLNVFNTGATTPTVSSQYRYRITTSGTTTPLSINTSRASDGFVLNYAAR